MYKNFDRKIVFEDGREFYGYGFGATTDRVCEIVFNTSMVGYQEIVSDPSCTYQLVVMTYPLIGNYGVADEDFETKVPTIGGLVVRDYNDMPSNFRYTKTLSEVLEENGIPGIYGVDTRMLTRLIRDYGSKKVFITDASTPKEDALKILGSVEIPKDAVEKVSCKKRWYSRTSNHKYNVVAIDCGITFNNIRLLNNYGCNVTVVPYNTSSEEIEFMNPDGIFISNGPGNPEDVLPVIESVKKLKGKYPIFGIGLGHLIICLAYGAKTYKMKYGHHGGNHPVRNLKNNTIEIVSQNYSYSVDEKSLDASKLTATHTDLLDKTIEGVENIKDKVFSVQFQPGNDPGPEGSTLLFKQFIDMMKEEKDNA
ncbi:MAG: glutamine-hydrolyzing carbamoyl-phosphate synthase small subunit [Clostridia bacterium]|nr:glutamine-hydrolyzing carbamoyl-phosphate synthase small subunit [Clostridia bacterium]